MNKLFVFVAIASLLLLSGFFIENSIDCKFVFSENQTPVILATLSTKSGTVFKTAGGIIKSIILK